MSMEQQRACREGHRECVEFLLKHNAQVNDVDSDGWTALHHSAQMAMLTLQEC